VSPPPKVIDEAAAAALGDVFDGDASVTAFCVSCGHPPVTILAAYCCLACAHAQLAAILALANSTPRRALSMPEWHDAVLELASGLEYCAQHAG